jgi:hypothetical protein
VGQTDWNHLNVLNNLQRGDPPLPADVRGGGWHPGVGSGMHKSGGRTRTGAPVALRAYDLHTRRIDATRSRPTVFRPAMRVPAGGHDRARVGAQETGSAAWLLRPEIGLASGPPLGQIANGVFGDHDPASAGRRHLARDGVDDVSARRHKWWPRSQGLPASYRGAGPSAFATRAALPRRPCLRARKKSSDW